MNKFIKDIRKYWKYTVYAAKSDLKSEVSASYLNWLWWILDPLLFMLVYVFIALIVFQRGEQYFPIYVFIGLTTWNFFNKTVNKSVKIIKSNSSIVSKVYIPKFILIIQRELVNGFKMLVSFLLIFVMMLIYRVPLSWKILYTIPLVLLVAIVTFGVGSILSHFGVFFDDLNNIVTVLLKLVFYMSGVFYSIADRVPEPFNQLLLKLNPVAFAMDELRGCLLYNRTPDWMIVVTWIVVGILLSAIGVRTIYKYENSYVKVI